MRVSSAAGRLFSSRRRLTLVLVVLALAAFCPACSSGRKPVHPVRGQVLVNGKPAIQAQVLLHPAAVTGDKGAEAVKPTGQTDQQGYFTLTSYANSDGAPEGTYAVTVTWFRVASYGKNDVYRYNALPPRYASPQTSSLQVTIDKDTSELPPLQLSVR